MSEAWIQVITIIGANVALSLVLFLWIRSEANSDRREIHALIGEIQKEMTDFHVKLCEIGYQARGNKSHYPRHKRR